MDLALIMEKLRPGENVSPDLSSYDAMIATWRGSGEPPSQKEITDAWDVSVKSDYDESILTQKRASSYPSVGDQLDFISKIFAYLTSKGIDIGPDGAAYIAAINAVKSQIK